VKVISMPLATAVEVVTLDDMQLLGVRRAITIERTLIVNPIVSTDQRVAIFVVAVRFTRPE